MPDTFADRFRGTFADRFRAAAKRHAEWERTGRGHVTLPVAVPKPRRAKRSQPTPPKPSVSDYVQSGLSALQSFGRPEQTLTNLGWQLGQYAPTAYANVSDYFSRSSPSDVLDDIWSGTKAYGRYIRDNPVSATLDFIPVVGDVKGFGEDIKRAAELRAAGDISGANLIEQIALPLAVAGLVPGVGEARTGGKLAVRAAREAADEASDLAVRGVTRAGVQPGGSDLAVLALPAPPKMLALPAPGPGLPSFAVKHRGGQWRPDRQVNFGGGYSENFSPEASARVIFKARFPDLNPELEPETAALRTWFERALPRYIKNELGTPEDPLRGLAEQGLLHLPDLSPEGWSRSAARAITGEPIGAIMFPANRKGGMPGVGNDYRGGLLASMPWLAKAPVTDELYSVTPQSLSQLGFSHVIDEMQQALYPEHFGLPLDLAVRPESLDRMSFAAAVERVGKIGQWRNKQAQDAMLRAVDNPATHTFKEYPENNPLGLRWVELKAPELTEALDTDVDRQLIQKGDAEGNPFSVDVLNMSRGQRAKSALEEALRYEGDTMGHCVGDYCPAVLSGRSRIFSLRDAKGEPHVTIETKPGAQWHDLKQAADEDPDFGDAWNTWRYGYDMSRPVRPPEGTFEEYLQATDPDLLARFAEQTQVPNDIIQIKGKQDRAPKDDYLPFVQDFVKSQQWGNVGDLANTGLVRLPDGRYITAQQWNEGVNSIKSPWRQPGQYDEQYLSNLSKAEWDYMAPYFQGYAIGGRVSPDRCFCRHPMSVR